MDGTQWPPQQTQKSIQDSEGRAALLCEISPAPLNNTEAHLFGNAQPRSSSVSRIDASIFTRSAPPLSFASQQARGFHTSSRAPYDSTSYNVTDVPDFFIKYKEHRATSSNLVSPIPIFSGRYERLTLYFPGGA